MAAYTEKYKYLQQKCNFVLRMKRALFFGEQERKKVAKLRISAFSGQMFSYKKKSVNHEFERHQVRTKGKHVLISFKLHTTRCGNTTARRAGQWHGNTLRNGTKA